jgi:molybdate/tungstate transport system substrate-binding protein
MYLSNTYARLQARRARQLLTISLVGAAGAALAVGPGITAASAATPRATTTQTSTTAGGDVDVISAGSLDTVITKKIAPAFKAATGYTLVDTSGSSGTDATDIKNKVDVEDVFLSAAPSINKTLEGAKNGSWVSWYADFATSPYVLGYDPKSKFAKDLKTMPWYKVITMPGFRLGRTNPTQDPGGVLAIGDLKAAAKKENLPALTKLASESSDVYVEDTEEADIQNGQLDASFMYEADANSQDSPFVKLTGVPTLYGDYTMTILKNAPHEAAAEAFVKFMLGAKGHALLKADSFGISTPTVTGSGVPSGLSSVLK